MKQTVIKPFIDKHTLIGYSLGDTFESTDSERVSFLQAEGYLNIPDKPKRTRKKASEEDAG